MNELNKLILTIIQLNKFQRILVNKTQTFHYRDHIRVAKFENFKNSKLY